MSGMEDRMRPTDNQRREVEALRLSVRRTAAALRGLRTVDVDLDDDGRPVRERKVER